MSPHRVSSIEPTMADLIESGRQLYTAKKYKARNYKRALGVFTSAMRSCPCARGMKRGRCTCKNYEMVASRQDSIYGEAMYTCHCVIARTFGKCANKHHIEALDLRATTFAALGQLDNAVNDAEWMLELAPKLPDGYLRLGKIAQLQENDEYAWKVYTAGIEANQDTTIDCSPRLQDLYDAREPLNRLFFRQDPLSLPAEIVTNIFSFMESDELLHSLRVSKQWTCTLTSHTYAPLWRDMTFSAGKKNRGPSKGELKKMLSWAGDGGARKILIPRRMRLTDSKLALLLKASPSLERLKVLHLPMGLLFPSKGKTWNRLTYLSLDLGVGERFRRPNGDGPARFPHDFIQNAASSLEHLNLMGIPAEWHDQEPLIPHLPNLKTLRITHSQTEASFSVFPLSIAFPNLEQLCMGPDLPDLDPTPLSIWRERRQYIWPHLKVLIFEFRPSALSTNYAERTRLMLRYLMCLSHGNSLQHICFKLRIEIGNDFFSLSDTLIPDFDDVQDLNFQNLRFFSSNFFCLLPDGARTLLSNSVQTQRLTSFDIVFMKHTVAGRSSLGDLSRLRSYEWARGAPSIQALGFYRFRFWCYPEDCEYHPLAEFVATFPNLRTLSIWSPYYGLPELARLVGLILKVTHLETIYMLSVGDEAFAQLRQAARNQGVRLMEMPELRQWPVPLGA